MSQHYEVSECGRYKSLYGWDEPLQSYFYVVWDISEEPKNLYEDEEEIIVADSMLGIKRITDVSKIMESLEPFTPITKEDIKALEADRAKDDGTASMGIGAQFVRMMKEKIGE